MSDDNKKLLDDLEQKLGAIDDRLKQIAGYKFVPPSVKQEKDSLEKQRNILETTKSRIGGFAVSDDSSSNSLSVDAAVKSIGSDGEESASSQPDFGAADRLSTGVGANNTAGGSLVGDNYSVSSEDRKLMAEEDRAEADENRTLLPRKDDIGTDEFSLEEKKGKISTLDGIVKKVEEVVSAFKKALDQSGDNPDRDYLSGVVDEFDKTVNDIIEKAKNTKMSDNWRARAVKGRLASYVGAVKADFSFSDLLNDEIETKINELLS